MHTHGLNELRAVLISHFAQLIVGCSDLVNSKIYFFVRIVSNMNSLNLNLPLYCPVAGQEFDRSVFVGRDVNWTAAHYGTMDGITANEGADFSTKKDEA